MNNIISQIKTILQSITAVKAVYDFEPDQITAYPAVSITPIGWKEEYLTLRDIKRTYSFSLKVYANMTDTESTAQSTIRDVIDSVLNNMAKSVNQTLGGTIDYPMLTEGSIRFVVKESQMTVGEIAFSVITRFNRYS